MMSFTLRAALSINNSGVGLLETGHFREAQRTFRDALTLMKQVINPASSSHHCTTSQQNDVHETLQRISMSLVRAQAKPILTLFDIRAIEDGNDDDGDLSSIKSALDHGPSSSLFFPIRIRSSQQQDEIQKERITRPMAIILYNQALSHLLWGKSKSSSSLKDHFQAAVSCLKVAHLVLSHHASRVKDTFQRQCSMLVQALVINNLIQVLLQAKNQLVLDTGRLVQRQRPPPQQGPQEKSLQDWIELRDHLLVECDLMDDNQVATMQQVQCLSAAAAA